LFALVLVVCIFGWTGGKSLVFQLPVLEEALAKQRG